MLHLRGLLAQGESAFERGVRAVRGLIPAGDSNSPTHLLLAQLLNGQARFLLNRGQPSRSEEKARAALTLARAGAFHLEEAHALMQIGITYGDRGEYELAHEMHDRADEILARLLAEGSADPWKTRNWRSTNYKQKSDAYWAIGSFEQVIRYVDQSLALDEMNRDVRGAASCYHRKGIVARIQGDYDRAVVFFEKSQSLASMAGYRRLQHLTQSSLALTYSDRGDNQRAEAYFQEFYQVSLEAGDRVSQLTALINLGLVAARAGDYLRAKAYYERGLSTSVSLDSLRNRGILLGNLGIIAMRLGDFDEAERLFADSLAARLSISDRTGEKYSRFYIARLALCRKAFDTVLEETRKVLDLSAGGTVRDVDNLARTAMGHALAALGRLEEAAACYREVIASWEKSGQSHLLPAPRSGLARIALLQGEVGRAVALCNEIITAAPELNLESTFEPFDIWLTCIEVLKAAGDPRAPEVLREIFHRLQERAEQLPAALIRDRFLNNIRAHREIVRLADAQSGP
jgi:tetratricopeptide (TPR) repeat protein